MRESTRRRGSLTVEMAVTLPVLFLFVFAALEFAGMNVIRHTVDNAAYEAARRGIVPGATVADVVNEATVIMGFVGAENVTVNVVPATITQDTDELTVTVNVPVAGNGWMSPMIFGDTDVMVGECRMFREDY